jgi:hypothetical protein
MNNTKMEDKGFIYNVARKHFFLDLALVHGRLLTTDLHSLLLTWKAIKMLDLLGALTSQILATTTIIINDTIVRNNI